jgi:hypothetical protein
VSVPLRPSFLGRPVPAAFDARRVVLVPGEERLYVESEWQDAIVLVESGGIELEGRLGSRRRFARGDVLWLIGLSLCVVRNDGPAPAVLVAVSRQRKLR